MNVTVEEPTPDEIRLAPSGYIDVDTVRVLRSLVERMNLAPGHTVVLDLTDVGFMDSAGLTFLVWLHRRVTALPGTLRVVGTQPSVAKVLRLTGIDLYLGAARPTMPQQRSTARPS
ncbi:MAG: STAS domain-containing protein [Actinomycetes bacterium]